MRQEHWNFIIGNCHHAHSAAAMGLYTVPFTVEKTVRVTLALHFPNNYVQTFKCLGRVISTLVVAGTITIQADVLNLLTLATIKFRRHIEFLHTCVIWGLCILDMASKWYSTCGACWFSAIRGRTPYKMACNISSHFLMLFWFSYHFKLWIDNKN